MAAQRILLADLLRSTDLLADVARRLDAGEVCVYPTETIYGIGGRADSDAVRLRIIAAKKRPPENPMILIAASLSSLETLDLVFPDAARRLAAEFWPGNLTLVLPSRKQAQPIGVRVSDHPFIAALGAHLNVPVFSSSANYSGEPYVGAPDTLYKLFRDSVDFMVDAGELPKSLPSTVVNVSADSVVTVLREGAIPTEHVRRAVSEL
jgi:L-threonylcarbamoyladenylate synthase